MIKKKLILGALILCISAAAALTSCGGNGGAGSTGGTDGERVTSSADKETGNTTDKNIIDDLESGVSDIGSDIEKALPDREDATHGTTEHKDRMGFEAEK